MRFEDYVREELKKIDKAVNSLDDKVDKLMIFMAVQKTKDSRNSKISSSLISLIVSLIVLGVGKFL